MRTTQFVQALLLAVALATVGARPAVGQVLRFEPADTTVDLSTYATLEQCLVAISRVRRSLEVSARRAALDTLDMFEYHEFGHQLKRRPEPPESVETARTCLTASAEYTDTTSLRENFWGHLARVYLIAGWDDRARAVVEQRIAAVEPDSVETLRRLFFDILTLYEGGGGANFAGFNIRQPRPEVGEDIVLEHIGTMKSRRDRFGMYLQMFANATKSTDVADDSEEGARARRNLARLQAELAKISDRELEQWQQEDPGAELDMTAEEIRDGLEALAILFSAQSSIRDSLRVSTAAYVKTQRELWARANQNTPEAYPEPIGERAPKLEGDIWFGCEQEPCEARPRQGRISLVWIKYPRKHVNVVSPGPGINERVQAFLPPAGQCTYAKMIRRLEERFPELDITYVTEADGLHGLNKEGITPEREAELEYECFKSFGVERMALSMTVPFYWRLPEPDGRPVFRESANRKNYKFGETWSIDSAFREEALLLIDEDGYIVHTGQLNLESLKRFEELIQILVERKGSAR